MITTIVFMISILMFVLVFLVKPEMKKLEDVKTISKTITSGTIVEKKIVMQQIDYSPTQEYVFEIKFNVILDDNFEDTYEGHNFIVVTEEEYEEYSLYEHSES